MTTPIQITPQNRVIANSRTTAEPAVTNKRGSLPPEIQSLLLNAYANSLPSSSIKNKLVAQFKAALLSGDLKAGPGDTGFAFKELIQKRYSALLNNADAQKAFYEALEKTSKLCETAVNFGIKKLAEAIKKATEATVEAGVTPPPTSEMPAPTTTAPAAPKTPTTQPQIALSDKDKKQINAASGLTVADINQVATNLRADSSEQNASAVVKAYVSESSIMFALLENNRAAFEALKIASPETAAVIDQALNSQLSLQERMAALDQLSKVQSAAAILGGEMQARLQSLVATGKAASTASS